MQYLRVVEQHKDFYPHFHIILQFPDAVIRVRDSRWFERTLYKSWKAQWTHGNSDYQKPRRNRIGTISYVMKYLLKNTTQKTIWKKTLSPREFPRESETSDDSLRNRSSKEKMVNHKKIQVRLPVCGPRGIKLCTWSRKFDWEPFKQKTNP